MDPHRQHDSDLQHNLVSSKIDGPMHASKPHSDATSESAAGFFATTSFSAITCARCGKNVSQDIPICPYCEARIGVCINASAESTGLTRYHFPWSPAPIETESTIAITRLLIFYLMMLATNLVGHWVVEEAESRHLPKEQMIDRAATYIIIVESIVTALVLAALVAIPWPPRIASKSSFVRAMGWLTGPFVLAIVLALNFGYHALLHDYAQYPEWFYYEDVRFPIVITIVTTCIQPAIIEELFFRFIALGTLTRVMGTMSAVLVSSVMFGMAHSGVVLSIPILTVVGIGLGLVRVWSGSIVLPVLLHALHNAVVVYLESNQ